MSQYLRLLLYKNKNPEFEPQNPHKNTENCNLNTPTWRWEVETKASWETLRPTSLSNK